MATFAELAARLPATTAARPAVGAPPPGFSSLATALARGASTGPHYVVAAPKAGTAAAPKGPGKPQSLLGQFGHALAGIVPGLAQGAVQSLETMVAPLHVAFDVATGNLPKSGIGGAYERYLPIAHALTSSVGQAGQDVLHPERFGQAVAQGQIVNKILNDLGVVGIATGVAAPAFGTLAPIAEAGAEAGAAGAGEAAATEAAGRAAAAGGEQAAAAEGAATGGAATKLATANLAEAAPEAAAAPAAAAPVYRGLGARWGLGPEGQGYSVARSLQEAGSPEAAANVARVGQALRNVSELTNTATGQTLPQAALGLAGRGVGLIPGVPAASEWLPNVSEWAQRGGTNLTTGEPGRLASIAQSVPFQRLAQRTSQEGKDFAAFKDEMNRGQQAAQRHELQPLLYAQDLGLTPEEQRVVTMAVSQRGRAAADLINRAGTAGAPQPNVGEMVRRMYEGVSEDQRPTVEDVRNLADYLGGRMDPGRRALIDQVAANVREHTARMTAQKLQAGELGPAQTGTDLLPHVVQEVRAKVENERDKTQRDWFAATNKANADVRRDNAWAAVRAELPAPPVQGQVFARGRAAGLADAGAQAAADRARTAQRQLEVALAEYSRDVESGADRAVVDSRAATVDRLTTEINGLVDLVNTRERRVQATQALSRAGVEVTPGQPIGPPEISTGDMPKVTELRARLREHSAGRAQELRSELARVTGNQKLQLTPRRRFAGQQAAGEFNWPETVGLTERERLRMIREGLMANESGKAGNDILAETMSNALNRPMSVDEAAQHYMDLVRATWDAQAGRSDEAVTRLANETGLSPVAISAALRGTRNDYMATLTGQATNAFGSMRNEYNALPEEERNLFVQVFNQLRADPQVTRSDYQDLLSTFLPQSHTGGPESPAASLLGLADEHDIAQSLIGGTTPDTIRTFTTRRTPAGQRQVGARTAEVAGARQLLSSKRRDLARARTDLVRAVREGDRNLAAIRNRFDRAQADVARANDIARLAQSRADATAAFAAPTLAETQAGRTWQRFRGAPSAGERTAFSAGRHAERAHASTARVGMLERSLNRLNQKVADVPTELSRSWQSRLGDINDRANTQLTNTVRRSGPDLGALTLAPTKGGFAERLTGELARLGELHGVRDELTDVLRRAETTAGKPLSAHTRGELLVGVLRDRGIELDSLDQQALASAVSRGHLLEMIDDTHAYDVAHNVHSNTPRRVAALIHDNGQWMPQEMRNAADAAAGRYESSRAGLLDNLMDDQARAAPAPYRDMIQDSRREIRTLHAMADQADRVSGARSGDYLRAIAEDVPNTIDAFVKANIEPTYLIGGKTPRTPFTGTYRPGQMAATRAGKVRTTGLGPVALGDVARANVDEAARLAHNQALEEFTAQFGKPAWKVLGEQIANHENATGERMTADQLTAAARANGWVPAGQETTVTPETVVVPKWMKDQLEEVKQPNGLGWRALRKTNRLYKTVALPLSPKWLVHRSIGNVIQAMIYGGVDPIQVAQQFRAMTKESGGIKALYRRGGIPDSTPAELLAHGLTHGEFNAMYPDTRPGPRGPLAPVIKGSYNLNSFLENATRAAVYRQKLADGMPSPAAVRSSVRAMGDYQKLTPFERRKVATVLPFYPWIRHQTTSILRLPLEHPMRAVYLAQLANMLNDPNLSTQQLIAQGSNLPLPGGQYLNVGNVSPVANPMALPLSPLSVGGSLAPLLQFGIQAGLGVNPARNFAPLARPPATARLDPFGRPLPTPPWTQGLHGLGELGYLATSQVPYLRTLRNIALDPNIQRYATGYTASSGGVPYTTGKSRLGELWSGLNLPAIRPLPQVTGGK